MEEVWKDIEGFEGQYQISNFGRVRSMDRYVRNGRGYMIKACGKILKTHSTHCGYEQVKLGKNRTHRSVHRLVAIAFIPNPNNLPCVNHKDEDKMNNIYTNLEWCNHRYNVLYGTCQERLRKYKNQPVFMIDKDSGEILNKYDSMKIAMEKTGVHKVTISQVCRGERKTGGGYLWKYAEKSI